jgi:hypothetical protein
MIVGKGKKKESTQLSEVYPTFCLVESDNPSKFGNAIEIAVAHIMQLFVKGETVFEKSFSCLIFLAGK